MNDTEPCGTCGKPVNLRAWHIQGPHHLGCPRMFWSYAVKSGEWVSPSLFVSFTNS